QRYVYIVLRIKSERVDNFLNSISSEENFTNLKRSSTDVSLAYQDKTTKINSLNSERERLIDLMENANMSELLQINTRISEIDYQLSILNQEKNELDSLIDYSEVELRIQEIKTSDDITFGKK